MKNSIFNEYGAITYNGIGQELMGIVDQNESNLRNFIIKHNLNPIEIRCVQAFVSQNAVCAEQILTRAIKMKKDNKG